MLFCSEHYWCTHGRLLAGFPLQSLRCIVSDKADPDCGPVCEGWDSFSISENVHATEKLSDWSSTEGNTVRKPIGRINQTTPVPQVIAMLLKPSLVSMDSTEGWRKAAAAVAQAAERANC